MKKIIYALALGLTIAGNAFADDTIKLCKNSIKGAGDKVNVLNYKVFKRGETLMSGVEMPEHPEAKAPEFPAEIGEFTVRAGLNLFDGSITPDVQKSLNKGELLILARMLDVANAHSMRTGGFEANPGLDLSQIRAIKVFHLGKTEDKSQPSWGTIIEAKDASGNDLGSFIDNDRFGILPCEK